VSRGAAALLVLAMALSWPAPDAPPDPSRAIRVAYSSTADLGDLPSLLAQDRLVGQGYDVRATFFARAQLAVEAVARGRADVGMGSTRTYWAAVARGADLATVMEQVGNGWSVLATPDITSCRALHGKRLALSSEGSVSGALVRSYIQTGCPGTEPQIVIIPGSEHRAAALLSASVDASPVELAESVRLGVKVPGRFRTLVDFAAAHPRLETTGVHVNRRWAQRNPALLHAYLRALLGVHRQIDDEPALLTAEARRRLDIDADVVSAHLRTKAWDANGGLTAETVAYSLAFFTGTETLPAQLTTDHVADLGPLERVLAEIGRR
jgi:ABC-type nitrate/sulfonate/bicarbonate transport system substrate-binding protein